MQGTLKINHKKRQIIMNGTFAKYAQNCGSPQFEHLMKVKALFPKYKLVTQKIKKNPDRVEYKGLSTDFMRWYISEFSSTDEIRNENLEKFDFAMDVVGGERGGYGKIKSWFLFKYPAIKVNGVTKELKALYFDSTLESDSEEIDEMFNELYELNQSEPEVKEVA